MNRVLIDHIKRRPDYEWNFYTLSLNPYVTLSVLKEFRDRDWNYSNLTKNINFSWEWVREFPDKSWNMSTLSESSYFSWEWVREFPDKSWNWYTLSKKVNNIEIIKEFQDKPWSWYTLTLSPLISFDDMMQNPNFPWMINELLFTLIDDVNIDFLRYFRSHYDSSAWYDHTSRTPWSIIKKNMDLPWKFSEIRFTSADEFTEDDIKYLYSVNDWNMQHLSEKLDFHKIILKTPDLDWDYDYISKNPTITYRDVDMFPDIRWNLHLVNLELNKKEVRAVNMIKKQWKRSVTDPSYKLCHKIVLEDLFEALGQENKVI